MSQDEIRLQCIKIAAEVAKHPDDVLRLAKEIYAFVTTQT